MDSEGPKFTVLTPQMMDLKDALIQEFSDHYPKEGPADIETLYLRLSEFLLKPDLYRECLESIEFSRPVRPLWKDLPVFFPTEIIDFREAIIQCVLKFLPLRQDFEERRRYLQYSYELISGVCVADAIGDMRDFITEWRFRNSCLQLVESTSTSELVDILFKLLLKYYPGSAPEANKTNYLTFSKEFLSNRFFHIYIFPSAIPIRSEISAVPLNSAMESLQNDLETAVKENYPKEGNIFVRAQYLVRLRRLLTPEFFEVILNGMPEENKRNFREAEEWRYRDLPTFQLLREALFRILPRTMFR